MTVPYTFANQVGAIPLAELDANFAAIPNYANTAGTVTSNAQPNIASVGVLNSLSVNGNVTVTEILSSFNLYTSSTTIALGPFTGKSAANTISIGELAGNSNQSANSIAIGPHSGSSNQGTKSIAIGRNTAEFDQGIQSVAIGLLAAANTQGANSVAIGLQAATQFQGGNAVSLGAFAGNTFQGDGAVALGRAAGFINQGANATAVGRGAGNVNQGIQAVAVGQYAGNVDQGHQAIAIGAYAGNNAQGANSVAIGSYAGNPISAANSIAINGTATNLSAPYSGLFIAPINNDTSNITNVMYYNTSTKEVTYGPIGISSYGNANVAAYLPTYSGDLGGVATITATGNIVGANVLTSGVVSAAGNIRGANVNTAGIVTATGNIYGSYFIGDGSQLTGIVTGSVSNISNGTSNIAISTSGGNIIAGVGGTANIVTLTTTGMLVTGGISASGNITGNFVGAGAGTPTVSSNVNLDLSSPTSVRIIGGGTFRLPSLTSAEITALTPVNGDMVYNSTLNKFQGYENGAWGNLI